MGLIHLLVLISSASAYYVPGAYPQEFLQGDELQAYVNSLTSFETELPYDYYSLPFCKPPEGIRKIANTANLGTIIAGSRMENSVYNFIMMKKELAIPACKPDKAYGPLQPNEVSDLKHKIDNAYRVNLVLDNLPVTVYDLMNEDQEFVSPGFDLGWSDKGKYYINNHLVFNILVHETTGEYTRAKAAYKDGASLEGLDTRRLLASGSGMMAIGTPGRRLLEEPSPAKDDKAATAAAAAAKPDGAQAAKDRKDAALKQQLAHEEAAKKGQQMYMVVGFEVSPCSIERNPDKPIENIGCPSEGDKAVKPQEIKEGGKIVYTYDVYWQTSPTKWASRWDAYLRMPGGKVHWFSIFNSILIVLVMATLVAMILIRTVRRDLARYEELVVDGGDLADEAGWKLVAGDVFRAPADSKKLCVHFGSGVQIIVTATVTLFLAALGFLSPATRGALVTTTMVLYVLLASTAGFSAVWLWGLVERSYNGWLGVCTVVSVYYPGITMVIFTVLNLVIKHTGSTGAVPVGMYFSIVAVWFLISIPLTFLGGYLALKAPIIDYPVKTNQIPRHIPPAPVVAHPALLFFSAGVLPFGTMFIELYFAMTSLWMGYFYYLFGFVFVIGALTVIINAEIAILTTYVQLCAEDYLWWWRSFHRGGSVAMYIALYALGFLASTLHSLAGGVSVFLYLSYMTILILGLYFAMGTVGFGASFWFVYKIFKAVKQD